MVSTLRKRHRSQLLSGSLRVANTGAVVSSRPHWPSLVLNALGPLEDLEELAVLVVKELEELVPDEPGQPVFDSAHSRILR